MFNQIFITSRQAPLVQQLRLRPTKNLLNSYKVTIYKFFSDRDTSKAQIYKFYYCRTPYVYLRIRRKERKKESEDRFLDKHTWTSQINTDTITTKESCGLGHLCPKDSCSQNGLKHRHQPWCPADTRHQPTKNYKQLLTL